MPFTVSHVAIYDDLRLSQCLLVSPGGEVIYNLIMHRLRIESLAYLAQGSGKAKVAPVDAQIPGHYSRFVGFILFGGNVPVVHLCRNNTDANDTAQQKCS